MIRKVYIAKTYNSGMRLLAFLDGKYGGFEGIRDLNRSYVSGHGVSIFVYLNTMGLITDWTRMTHSTHIKYSEGRLRDEPRKYMRADDWSENKVGTILSHGHRVVKESA